ncbi:hypothetical protein L226DRAFT_565856 [Lentinus tigrinus ALCF2SS1-7]|nr:hypothetical protein L226DRAFT_565856 [Lentinus tigrinus ALCF2SS1-7]
MSWDHQHGQANYKEGTFSTGYTNAQAELRFNGTSVTVYGVATPKPSENQTALPPSISVSVDGGIPAVVVSNPDLQVTEYGHQFYDSRSLSSGEHTLQINVTYGEQDWPFVLDYIQYAPLPTGAASGLGPTDGGLSTATSRHSSVPVAAIVGSVLGCFALLVAAALFRYFRYLKSAPTKKRGPYIYTSAAAKVDLLDHEPKLPPPSRAVTPEPAADLESAYAASEIRFHTRTPSLSTEYLLSPPGLQPSFLDMSEARPEARSSSPSYDRPESRPYIRPGTPPASSVLGYQRSPTPSSLSFALLSRPGTPSTAAAFHRPITPPVVMHRSETPSLPEIVYRTTTPESYGVTPASRAGPSSMSKALQLEKEQALRAKKQPTFHADSGVRFKEGDALPEDVVMVSSQAAQARAERDKERKKREKEKDVSCGASAISEVPPMYTEE